MTDSESSNDRLDGDPSPAFDALADERRLSVLRTLYSVERDGDPHEENGLSFSTLYERTSFDDTPTFSYHLDKLTGRYVETSEAGYRLTATGDRVVQTVLGGLYADAPSFETEPVDATCPSCSASPTEFRYEDGIVVIECPNCSTPFVHENVQPALLADRSPEEASRAYERTIRQKIELTLAGVCPACSGQVDIDVRRSDERISLSWLAVSECAQCSKPTTFVPYQALRFHPVVISFYWDRGVDLTDLPFWHVIEFVTDGEWEPTVVDPDPFTCRVDIHRDGDTLSVALDDALRVTDATLETTRNPLGPEQPVD